MSFDLPKKAEDPAFDRDKFLLRQKHLAISEKYYVWDEQQNNILYIERPAHFLRNLFASVVGIAAGFILAGIFTALLIAIAESSQDEAVRDFLTAVGILGFIVVLCLVAIPLSLFLSAKRHVTIYRDDSKQQPLVEILQEEKFQFPYANYSVKGSQGQLLAKLRKNYLYDIFRKQWHCTEADGTVLCTIKEDELILALMRRLFGPFFGILRTNFVIYSGKTERVMVGEFNRKFTLLDRYVLDMSADTNRLIDRRIAVAIGVMLDTGERR